MRQIKNRLFSFAIVRALFSSSYLFIKANNNYYVFNWKKNGWAYKKTFIKIRREKMNIQEIYLPSGKQELNHVRCINKDCNSIMNMHDHSYQVTYAGDVNVNKYVCNHCDTEQHFISDEINGNSYYMHCVRKGIGDVYIKNNNFPEKEPVMLKHVS